MDWNAAVRALKVVHLHGTARDLRALERAVVDLAAVGDLEAAVVVQEWYAVEGRRQES